MKCTAIIQARMSSTRLPQKVLKPLAGKPILSHVIHRLKTCKELGRIVIATTDNPADDVFEKEFPDLPIFRGDEEDVLKRYYEAAKEHKAHTILRITSDSPLIDPEVIDFVIRARQKHDLDYVSNSLIPSMPDGLDCECFTFEALTKAFLEAKKPHEREHVTPYIRTGDFRLGNVQAKRNTSSLCWAVDNPSDLDFVLALSEKMDLLDPRNFNYEKVLDILKEHPSLMLINKQSIRDEKLVQSDPEIFNAEKKRFKNLPFFRGRYDFFKEGSFTFFNKAAILENGCFAPKMLNIEPTNECNCNCVMCTRTLSPRKLGIMDFELYKAVIRDLSKHNVKLKWLTLHNDGEPLLHPKLPEMIRYAKEQNATEYVHFNTNALLMTKDVSKALIQAGLDDLTLSVDGATEDTFQKVKRAGSYEQVKENARTMMALKKKMGKTDPWIRAKIIDMPLTRGEIPEFKNQWRDLSDELQVQGIHNAAGMLKQDAVDNRGRRPCSLLWYAAAITWDGRVTPCCVDLSGENSFGDVNKESILSIFNNQKMTEYRNRMLNNQYQGLKPCQACDVWKGSENIFQEDKNDPSGKWKLSQ